MINLKNNNGINELCKDCKFFNKEGYCNKLQMAVFENNHCCRFTRKHKIKTLKINKKKYLAEDIRKCILNDLALSQMGELFNDVDVIKDGRTPITLAEAIKLFSIYNSNIDAWTDDLNLDNNASIVEVQNYIDSNEFDDLFRDFNKENKSFLNNFICEFEAMISYNNIDFISIEN